MSIKHKKTDMGNWLKEKDKDVYCSYEDEQVIIGLSVIGNCPGKLIGEFEIKNENIFINLN